MPHFEHEQRLVKVYYIREITSRYFCIMHSAAMKEKMLVKFKMLLSLVLAHPEQAIW